MENDSVEKLNELKKHLLQLQSHLVMLQEDEKIPRAQRELIAVATYKNFAVLTAHFPGWTVCGTGEWPAPKQSITSNWVNNAIDRR